MNTITVNSTDIKNNTENQLDIILPNIVKFTKIVDATLKVKLFISSTENNTQVNKATIKVTFLNPIKASNYSTPEQSNTIENATNSDWIIDQIDVTNDKETLINVSDELQYVLDSLAINENLQDYPLKLKFECTGNERFTFNQERSLDINFISLAEFQGNGNENKIDLGKNCSAELNLNTGRMLITTPLVTSNNKTLPFYVNANYNQNNTKFINSIIDKNNNQINMGLPKNWTLNFNQFLIKNTENNNNNENNQNKEELSFTYIDENGKNIIFQEKYYYKDNGKKIYINQDAITIEQDQSLHYFQQGNDIPIFTTKHVSLDETCGYSQIPCKKQLMLDFFNAINKYKDKTLNINIYTKGELVTFYSTTLKLSTRTCTISFKNDEKKYGFKLTAYLDPLNETDDDAEPFDPTIPNYFYIEGYININEPLSFYYKSPEINTEVFKEVESVNGLKLVSSIKDIKGSNLIDYEPEELIEVNNTITQLEEAIKNTETSINSNRMQLCNTIVTMHANDNKTEENNTSTCNCNHTVTTYNDISYANLIESIKKYYENSSEFTNNNKEVNNEDYKEVLTKEYVEWFFNECKEDKTASKFNPKDYQSAKFQVKPLCNAIESSIRKLEEYQNKKKKYEYRKQQLELQVPVHYLYNENNVIYGFGKTSNENVFRLILITDPYENNLFISYLTLEDNKIDTISDADNNYAKFNYDENGLLQTIQDDRDRIVTFKYNTSTTNAETNENDDSENNEVLLNSITFADNSSLFFYYENNNLKSILNELGLLTTFTYYNNKVTNISAFSTLNSVKENSITYNTENKKFSSNLTNYTTLTPIDDQTLNITYNNYKSTTITNAKNKSITYLFNKLGNTIATYENKFTEDNANCISATEYSYSDNNLSEKVTKLIYSKNYLEDVSFSNTAFEPTDTTYLGIAVCSDYTYMCKTPKRQNFYSLSSINKQASIRMSEAMLNKLNNPPNEEPCSHRAFMVSGWAKADSAFIITDEDETLYQEHKNKKFEIRVEIKYLNDENINTFSTPFDWRNTSWQYCAVPVKLNENKQIESIICYLDYSNNIGTINFTNLDFYEADFEHVDYDNNKPTLKYSAHSNKQTEYEYNDNGNLIKEVISLKNNPTKLEGVTAFTTTYEYNKNAKLIKTTGYNGIVKERVYNNKGSIVKTLTYHKDEPATIFYEEHNLDDKGNETYSTNEFGEKVASYEYLNNTNIVETTTDSNGNKTSYGYDKCDNLLQTTTTVNGTENATTYGYTLDFLTSLKHNDFEINYSYDNHGRMCKIDIAGENYLTTTTIDITKHDESTEKDKFVNKEEVITLANGERYKKVYTSNGNLQELYFKSKTDTTEEFVDSDLIVQNIYDTHGNLVVTKEPQKHRTHKYFIDKFGNHYKEEVSFTDGEETSIPFSVENSYDDEHNKITQTKIMVENKELNYEYSYINDFDNKINFITMPNMSQNVAYDKLGRIKILNTDVLSSNFTYLKNGNRTSNLVSNVTYSKHLTTYDRLSYKYNEKGNITEIRNNNILIARYKYDSLNRLIREDNKELEKTVTYSYDGGGNITNKIEYDFTLIDNLDNEPIKDTFNYCYFEHDWKDRLFSYNDESFEYESGNPTVYRNKDLKWSHGRQLDKFGDIEFRYDSNGLRLSKIANNVFTKYYLNGNKIIAQSDTNNNTMYFDYGFNGVAGFTLNDNTYVYKKNIQNDIISIFDNNEQEIAKYHYDAWGNHTIEIWNGQKFVDISEVSSDNDYRKVAEINPFRYRSYYYDSETKLYYLNSRYYDPELCRFINADDISVIDITKDSINGLNLFAYCLNNPVNNVDENGNLPKWFFWILSIAAVVVGTVLVATGAAASFGGALISAGVGSIINGYMSEASGGSFAAGWIGGAFSGALSGWGATLSYGAAFLLGFTGNFIGTLITDASNGKRFDGSYWASLIGDSSLAGLVAIGASIFGKLVDLAKISENITHFIQVTIFAELAANVALLSLEKIVRDIAEWIDGLKGKRFQIGIKRHQIGVI